MDVLLLGVFVFLIGAYLYQSLKRPYKYPPGPQWFPIVGNSTQLKNLAKQCKGFSKAINFLAKQYNTSVVGMRFGSQNVVFVVKPDLVKDILGSDKFYERPDSFFNKLRSMGKKSGITSADGELWADLKNFTSHHIKQLGFGKPVMQDEIVLELYDLIDKLKRSDTCSGFGLLIAPAVINVLWKFTAGNRIGSEDPRVVKLLNLLSQRTKAFDMSGSILGQMPWLRYIAPDKTGYSFIVKLNKELKALFTNIIEEHKLKHTKGRRDDLVHAFLTEMESREEGHPSFNDDQLVMLLFDLFFGGSETVSKTLEFMFLFFTIHPNIQQKVYEEIKSVLNGRAPTLADKIKLPYTEAVSAEIRRIHHIVPINAPRRAKESTTMDGYIIPKDTTVFISFECVHKDPEHWENPDEFIPERWLNKEGQFEHNDRFIPFGYGRRRCIGDVMARAALFIFSTGVLQEFELTVPPGQNVPTLDPLPGITLSPRPYTVQLKPRKK